MRTVVTCALLLAGCAPRLFSEDAVGLPDPVAEWVAPDNGWPAATPDEALVGEGMSKGDLVYDVRGLDQFGDEVSIWQFWGQHVLVDISTMWCAPCQDLGRGTEATYQAFRDRGFVYLTVIHENTVNQPPSVEELGLWAALPSSHPDADHPYDEITAPIIADPRGVSGSIEAIDNNQYPAVLLVGPDMRVLERIEPATDARVHEVLERVLGPETE